MLLPWAKRVDQSTGEIFRNAQRIILLIFALEGGTPDGVNRLALLVHHVVIFEKMFTGLEVLGLDGLLRVLNAARNELRLNGHAFGHAQAVHQCLYAFAAKDTEEIVFERQKEARGAGIALAAGAAPQLV